MLRETILSRSFSRNDQRRLGCGAFLCCLLAAFSVCILLRPYFEHVPTLTLRLSHGYGQGLFATRETSLLPRRVDTTEAKMGLKLDVLCHLSEPVSDYCEMTGQIRVRGNFSALLLTASQTQWSNTSWKIRPYARKSDPLAMEPIREWSILQVVEGQGEEVPRCTRNHSVPAILFSFGGYAGNNFHAIADVIVPLFLTSRRFNREVKFLVTDMVPWSIHRFRAIFDSLSRYEVIDIDMDRNVHCFTKVIAGLKFHEELILDPAQAPHYSMKDFREFLRTSYSLRRTTAVNLIHPTHQRPRLLIISRNKTRAFTNVPEIVAMAESLGYEVTITELNHNMTRTAQVVNSCDVMMGVHGAGLTNFLFLPERAVLIQIVPIGGLDWHARKYFGDPARTMNVSYLEYKIKEEESSLIDEYPRDHLAFRDPDVLKKDWFKFKSICLDKQIRRSGQSSNALQQKTHNILGRAEMLQDTVLGRSFSRNYQKKLGYGAILCCLLTFFGIIATLQPYLGSLPTLPLKFSENETPKMLVRKEAAPSHKQQLTTEREDLMKRMGPLCRLDDRRSDSCRVNGDVRVQGISATVLVVSPKTSVNESYRIKPYARKGDRTGMSRVREWTILPTSDHRVMPNCTFNHRVPGVLFSAGGYSGNNFHAFTDIIVPLFLTSRKYGGEVHFLVTNSFAPWIRKFRSILEGLSRYDITNIDREDDVHCFPSVTVGLEHHKELTIDPSRSPYTMKDFRDFLRSTYSLKREQAIKLGAINQKRPRLLIISRKYSRAFTNLHEMVKLGESVGYEVVVDEVTMNLTRTAEVVNSCDVMLGVHGAGLTNFLFLPNKAVLIQVVPVGGVEVHAKVCFGDPSKHMNVSYLEYSISPRESSLIREFPEDHMIFRNPAAFHGHDWLKFKSVYLDKQDVEIDVDRFRGTLLKALQLLNQ